MPQLLVYCRPMSTFCTRRALASTNTCTAPSIQLVLIIPNSPHPGPLLPLSYSLPSLYNLCCLLFYSAFSRLRSPFSPLGHCGLFVSYKFSLLCLGLIDFYFLILWACTSPWHQLFISGRPTSSNLSRSRPCHLQLISFLSLCFFSTVFQLERRPVPQLCAHLLEETY